MKKGRPSMKVSKEEFPKHLSQFFSHVLYKKTEGNYLIFHSGDDPRIRSVLEDICIEYLAHEKYHSAFLNALLMQLWAMLLRYHENDIESILTRAYDGSPITEILNYISRSYQTATLHETAEHFMRMFKKTYGMTPGEYRKSSR